MFWGKLIPLPLQDLALMSLSTSKLVHSCLPPCPAQKWSRDPFKINETWRKGWGTSRKGVLNSSERAMEASKLSPSLSHWHLMKENDVWLAAGSPPLTMRGTSRKMKPILDTAGWQDEKNLRFWMTSLSCHVKHHWGIPAGGPVK